MDLLGYHLKETLSTSVRSLVRRAVREADGQPVVLKSLAQDFPSLQEIRSLEFEYRILTKLALPGVVRALALERQATHPILVLEDFGGRDLLAPPAGLALESFFQIALCVVATLGAIHEKGVIHKDIKPHNLLLNSETGEVRIFDFHIASELSQERQGLSTERHLQGSLPYISPEQTGRLNRELDYRTDYYSLGVTLFELATGRLPFQAEDVLGWAHAHISKKAPLAKQLNHALPALLSEIIAKLMAKDPDERYQTARGLTVDLEACREHWRAGSAPLEFRLGAQDIPDRFRVPQKLYGREAELQELYEVFEKCSDGPAKLLLVSGYSGVGKSALIQEIKRSIVARRGYLVSGKFDQLERNVPYGALLQALSGMIKQLLTESDQSLADWKRKLLLALGQSGKVMTDLIPQLEDIIGVQPIVAELNPTEAKHRFKRIFRAFIQALARPEHPVVLFLDDLQWMDSSTPDAIADLLANDDTCHLLVIGAYRDNEVEPGHALSLWLNEIKSARGQALHELRLRPLEEAAINQLVAETLRCSQDESAGLTRIIFAKTAGNPFFTNELLTSLHRQGAFTLDPVRGQWLWDSGKIERAQVSDNVVDLMVQRLRQFPDDARAALKVAACLGNQFDLGTLARISEIGAGQATHALWPAILQQIVVPLDGDYRLVDAADTSADTRDLTVRYQFQHDRLQQAAYALIDEQERAAMHLQVGRLLLSGREGEREENLFELVNHLNLGASLVDRRDERLELAKLNYRAAMRAKRSSAFEIAARYLAMSSGLLTPEQWAAEPEQRFELLMQQTECAFLRGDVQGSERLCENLLTFAGSPLSKASVYGLKTRILDYQGRFLDALASVRAGLSLLGLELPEDHAEIARELGAGIGKMQAHLSRVKVEDLVELPEMTDPAKVLMMNLLFQAISPAIQTHPPLFILADLMMFDLALSHGVTPVCCKTFVDCSIVQGGILGNYDVAYRLGQAAFRLLDRYHPSSLESPVNFVFAAFVSHWRAGYAEGLEAYARSIRVGLDMGDTHHVSYSLCQRSHRLPLLGQNLEECQAENERATAYLERVGAKSPLIGMLVSVRGVAHLLGSEDAAKAEREDRTALDTLKATSNPQWSYAYGVCQMMVQFLLGDLDSAKSWQQFTQPLVQGSLFSAPDYYLLEGLILTRSWASVAVSEREAALSKVLENQAKLRIWSENCQTNFGHKYQLLTAELRRIQGAPMEEVLQCYEAAATLTGDAFIQYRALSLELSGEYLLEKKRSNFARTALREAYQLYAHWGARAKIGRLEASHPGWFEATQRENDERSNTRTTLKQGASLDLSSVLKATQAISSEVRSDRLFAALMHTIIENAGAERGCLILPNESEQRLYVEARANVDGVDQESASATALELAPGVCHDIVRYVARTRETVVLEDALNEGAFQLDSYVLENAIKSVLCMPVLSQGNLIAVLYAENNAATRTFTRERLNILRVIASQAAISITNARLYDQLEHKVGERTRELAQRNRQIAAMLDNMEQGIFTIDAELSIQPEYSKHLPQILGTSEIAGRSCIDLVFSGGNAGPDAIATMESALRFSFGAAVFWAEANAHHFLRQLQKPAANGQTRFLELEWNFIVDESECVDRVLVTVRDVTALEQLKRVAAERVRETDIIAEILDSGLPRFREFCASSRRLLEDSRARLASGSALSQHTVDALFRNLHTVKGNARVCNYKHLLDTAHLVEEQYEQLRQRPESTPDFTQLQQGLADVLALITEYEGISERKLGVVFQRNEGQQDRALRELLAVVSAPDAETSPRQAVLQVRRALERLGAVSLTQLVTDTARIFPDLAQNLDKSVPIVQCENGETLLSADWARVIKDVFVHSFSNALAHGLESPEERHAEGKQPQGRIYLRTDVSPLGVRIHLSDDGRGLALDALRTRGGGDGETDEQLADTIFQAGVTTTSTVTAVAGRGVGLEAVRSFIRDKGGDVGIAFTGEKRAGYRPFELVLSLPADAVLQP